MKWRRFGQRHGNQPFGEYPPSAWHRHIAGDERLPAPTHERSAYPKGLRGLADAGGAEKGLRR